MCLLLVGVFVLACVLFFKQKTAYEMRISDGSSDVCSSDLSRSMPLASAMRAVSGLTLIRSDRLARGNTGSGPGAGAGAAGLVITAAGGALAATVSGPGCGRMGGWGSGAAGRTDERRVGKEGVSQGRALGSPGH